MALSDDESREAFAKLATILREAGLDWVLDQVAARIAYGKQEPIKESDLRPRSRRRTRSFVIPSETWSSSSTSKQLTRTVPFSPQERLRVLVQAISNAVIAKYAIEDEVTAFASRHGGTRVLFTPDQDEAQPASTLSPESTAARGNSVARLRALLDELSGVLHAA